MTSHSSATPREPHVNRTSRTNAIVNLLKQRAQAVLNDETIDPRSRAVIRQALETNDPWLARMVSRADADDRVVDTLDIAEAEALATRGKIEALTQVICGAGEEASAALFVLMATLQKATDAKALANATKHFAFTHCGELNVYGMVDAQVAALEAKLFLSSKAG